MVVNVIQGGDSAFDAMIYGQPTNSVLQYLNNSIESARVALGNAGSRFMDNARSMYEKFNGRAAIEQGKMLLMNIGSHVNQDAIYTVREDQIQNINIAMQRYVMSNPVVSKMYNKNMCYGYQETYLDNEPGVVGKDREDYGRVMDGMLYFDKDGDGLITHYSSSKEEDDLYITEKISILDTWHMVEQMIVKGIDPTDPNLGEL